jgi:hypothetical protein
MSQKWDAYVINLKGEDKRWNHMSEEFKNTPLNLIRWQCEKSTSGEGWREVGKTYADIMRKHMETDPEFKKLCVVFEDDAFRLQDKETFSKRINEIFPYLEQHAGTYSHFQGGGVYPQPIEIVSQDPLIIRCSYITCTTFTVFGKDAANSVFDYEKNFDTANTPIDNHIGNQNRDKMLAPFPHLVWQIIGLPSNISSEEQKVTLNDAFRNSHKTLLDFVKSKGLTNIAMGGGGRKKKGKTLSFLQSALHKFKMKRNKIFKHRKVSSLKTRKSYQLSKEA